jgi:putative ATPase
LLSQGSPLRKALESDIYFSFVLWGPAGCGKTTIAKLITKKSNVAFKEISAVSAGVSHLRAVIDEAEKNLTEQSIKTVVFIDEIHRFNKAQQDVLLPAVESGKIFLIGATTENPYFEINSPLLSRLTLIKLEPLTANDIKEIAASALNDSENGLGQLNLSISDEALSKIAGMAKGDARVALNILETCSTLIPAGGSIDEQTVDRSSQLSALIYDKDGDAHFDTVSAFIKSMRGSDPDAAVYWLAKMIEGGEHPEFIARRMIIFASEDIGLADNDALTVAVNAARALSYVGLPEAKLNLAHAAIYMSLAPKSNSVIKAITEATREVKRGIGSQVPGHLRDSHYVGAKKINHGVGYKYPHNYKDNYVDQNYLPTGLGEKKFYFPSEQSKEVEININWSKIKNIK